MKGIHRYLLGLIMLLAFVLRWWVIHLDPFLHNWDERFHALVARNLMEHPWTPRLRPVSLTPFDYKLWCCNEIWVHKQPLFLWQMALSMKLFGISEFTVRYPSLIIGVLMVPMLYQLGKWFSDGNRWVGLTAALFQACSYSQLELTSGMEGMDHNDMAMTFYTLASFWAFSRYTQASRETKIRWAVLIGVFAGCAILNKWLLGLLVFGAWGIWLLALYRRDTRPAIWKNLRELLLAVGACLLVFVPWQLHILHAFPLETAYEFEFNRRHITEVLEGHGGEVDYFWTRLEVFFGPVVWILVPVSFFYFLRKNLIQAIRPAQLAVMSCFLVVFVFLSFIVKTKVTSHFVFVTPLALVMVATVVKDICTGIRRPVWVWVPMAVLIAFLQLQHVDILKRHDPTQPDWMAKQARTRIYKSLRSYLRPGTTVVLNAPVFEDVEAMFYNPGILVASYVPQASDLRQIILKRAKVAYFPERSGYGVPDYLRTNPNAYELPVVPR
ncbi:MAG: phospholipid carrier-dependent glycosyltransferase [Sphingobacteriales bacterium]|nr:MAG: phospholipid carrier-dependent glycosyltransferase [Sphingobacteriales bacterium]